MYDLNAFLPGYYSNTKWQHPAIFFYELKKHIIKPDAQKMFDITLFYKKRIYKALNPQTSQKFK